jgi:hypothetical protein
VNGISSGFSTFVADVGTGTCTAGDVGLEAVQGFVQPGSDGSVLGFDKGIVVPVTLGLAPVGVASPPKPWYTPAEGLALGDGETVICVLE